MYRSGVRGCLEQVKGISSVLYTSPIICDRMVRNEAAKFLRQSVFRATELTARFPRPIETANRSAISLPASSK